MNIRKYIVMIFPILLGIQIIFYYIQKSQSQVLVNTFQGLFREESNQSKLFRISRSISDFEQLGLFRCSRLSIIKPQERIFLDLSYKESCSPPSFLLLNGYSVDQTIEGLSGALYSMHFITNNSSLFYLSLWAIRLIFVVSSGLIYKYFSLKVSKQEKIIELESSHAKELIHLAAQVSHDIRSPLTALNMTIKRV